MVQYNFSKYINCKHSWVRSCSGYIECEKCGIEQLEWFHIERLASMQAERDYAGRLYWRMRAERDCARAIGEFYEGWHIELSNCCFEKSGERDAANARIAELEAQLAARDERTCDNCGSYGECWLHESIADKWQEFSCSDWKERG